MLMLMVRMILLVATVIVEAFNGVVMFSGGDG